MVEVNNSRSPIETFFYDVYGYAKIRDVCDKKKPKDKPLRDFLDDTIIGTFRSKAVDEDNFALKSRIIMWPRISLIRHIPGELPYYNQNRSWFAGMNNLQVGEFLERRVLPLFPETNLEIKNNPKGPRFWFYTIQVSDQASEFFLSIEGTTSHNSKMTIINFNLPSRVVDDLNHICHRYHAIMNNVTRSDSSPESETQKSIYR